VSILAILFCELYLLLYHASGIALVTGSNNLNQNGLRAQREDKMLELIIHIHVDSQHRTDDLSKVGRHVFEVKDLGLSPYRPMGEVKKAYVAGEGAQPLPARRCDYCGEALIYCYVIKSRDNKTFEVGCDCLVKRVHDHALVRAFKQLPEVRARHREAAKAKDGKVQKEWMP
jgi:hypothetical protein